MKYKILPCTDEDSDFIDEQSDQAISAAASVEEDDEEEVFVYKVTDPEGRLNQDSRFFQENRRRERLCETVAG